MKVISDEIDCDLPFKIIYLEYDVILTDGVWTTEGAIKIQIKDINNKEPLIDSGKFEQQISIYENETTGFWIQKIYATDADRDRKFPMFPKNGFRTLPFLAPHCDLRFTINYVNSPELQNLFKVDITTGDLSVNLVNNAYLDRDNGVEFHLIHINIEDNYLGNGRKYTFLGLI